MTYITAGDEHHEKQAQQRNVETCIQSFILAGGDVEGRPVGRGGCLGGFTHLCSGSIKKDRGCLGSVPIVVAAPSGLHSARLGARQSLSLIHI